MGVSYLLIVVYFLKKGTTAYIVQEEEEDLIFAMNKPGSYFGELEFGISTEREEATR